MLVIWNEAFNTLDIYYFLDGRCYVSWYSNDEDNPVWYTILCYHGSIKSLKNVLDPKDHIIWEEPC